MSLRKSGLILIVLFLSCSGSDQPENHTIETKDGVKYVHNLFPAYQEGEFIQIEFVRKIGGLDSPDENLNFYNPVDLTVDRINNLFILDKGNYRVVKIAEGNFVSVFGANGEGPGEFTSPGSINLRNDGNLIISDDKKYHVFSTEGMPVRTRSLPKTLFDLTILESGNLLSRNLGESTLLKISLKEGTVLTQFGIPFEYETHNKTTLSNRIYYTPGNDNIYVSFKHANRIQKYSRQGELELESTRALNYEITYEEKRTRRIKDQFVRTGRGWSLVSKGIAVDDRGLIWITTADRQESDEEFLTPVYDVTGRNTKSVGNSPEETDMYRLEVYDNSGVLQCEIPLDHFCDSIKIFGDRLFIIDKDRGMCVYEYKIIR
ncbi:6-bladed beta-propeller [candidate division KSB1 bacterium]